MKHGAKPAAALAGIALCALQCLQSAGAQAAPYQDRIIGGALPPDISPGDGVGDDSAGLARALQLDAVVSALGARSGSGSNDLVENGVIAKSQWDTVALGAWSLDGAVRTGGAGGSGASQGQGGVLTLRQRDLPIDEAWQADTMLGDGNAPTINLARLQPRFFLPTATLEGMSTEWRGPAGLQLVAGGGVPGAYEGVVVPDFRALPGYTATAGAEWSPIDHWTMGGQFIDAHSENLAIGSVALNGDVQSSRTALLSAAWQTGVDKVQLSLLEGAAGGKGGDVGAWADALLNQGHVTQSAGLFHIDPNLTWGNQLISNDVEGGYYRLNYHTRQWLADAGVDVVRSVSGLGSDIAFLTADARYQLSRDSGIGGVANLSHSPAEDNWSLQGFVEQANPWGNGRVQGDLAHAGGGQNAGVTVDQSWDTPFGIRLSTSASLERVSGSVAGDARANSTLLGLGVVGGGQFSNAVSAEGNLHWAAAVQGAAAPGVSAAMSLTYNVSQNWQLLATLYESRVGSWSPLTVESPLTPPIAAPIPAAEQRGIFLTLRYKRATGLHFAPLGGAPGAASGQIGGAVYLDANSNGRRDGGEAGAANVTVVLDGRYSLQTDANGRFDFPAVAAGRHVVTVIPDNLPLPWTLVEEGRVAVVVTTRGRTEVEVAAQRPR